MEAQVERASVLAAVCFFSACGGSSGCDFSKIDGTYAVHFDEEPGGQCGAIPDINVIITAGSQIAGMGCIINNQEQDEAACTSDADITCTDAPDNIKLRQIAHLEAKPDGSSLSGTDTIEAADASTGATECVSTYKIKYTRQ